MSRYLKVLLYDQVIGSVEQDATGRHSFTYEEWYGETPSPTPLSLSMPVAFADYPRKYIEPWMLGLLPDNDDVRQSWGNRLHVSGANPFALLEHMGLDCAGAVQFISGDYDGALKRSAQLKPLSEADIAGRIAALRNDDTAWTVPGDKWSLAGAQGKFAVAQSRDGNWYEPGGAAPSTHIIKPGVANYRDQALNEHVCLGAARTLGLQAVRSEFLTFEGQTALVVPRYDRRRERGSDLVRRLHQEDMCQALSVFPHRKYESSGGPTAARVAEVLARIATDPARDVLRFTDAVAYNYLIGAPDAHAKNYSVLLAGNDVRLAPLYDVASAFPYEPSRSDHELDKAAMAIGGHRQFGSVDGEHWDRFADQCGVPRDVIRASVTRLAQGLPDALTDALFPFRFTHSALRKRLIGAISAHCERTLTGLQRPSAKPIGRPVKWSAGLEDRL